MLTSLPQSKLVNFLPTIMHFPLRTQGILKIYEVRTGIYILTISQVCTDLTIGLER